MNIDNSFREEIKAEIKRIEDSTECEVVPMIIKSSNRYIAANYTLGIAFSIIATTSLYFSPFYFLNPIYYILAQILFFILGYFIGYITPIKRFFVLNTDKEFEVVLRANHAFLHHNLHLTENHNGVLIFISLFERKIKIICDKKVKEIVEQEVWDKAVSEFVRIAKTESIENALRQTLKNIDRILSFKFPRTSPKINASNELSNELIIEL